MPEFLAELWRSGPFIPHGHCYLWNTPLVWLHLLSDLIIAFAYYSIPLTLLYFVQKRQDVPFPQIFALFGAFIVACGTTHLMEIWTLWHPTYWLSGAIKALTAAISLYTATVLVPLVPQALTLASPGQLAIATQALTVQIAERERAEASLRIAYDDLDRRIQARTVELAQANRVLQAEIAERQRTEALLQQTTALQRAILDSANYTIISTAVDGTILTFNKAAERWLGYTEAEIVGKVTPALIHDRDEVAARSQTLSQELGVTIEPGFEVFVAKTRRGEVEAREWSYIRKDGSRFPVELSVTALRDESNNITGFLGIGNDVAERKQALAALQESEARLQAFIDNAGSVIYIKNIQGQYILINRQYETLFHLDRTTTQGKTDHDIFPQDIADTFRENDLQVLTAGKAVKSEELAPQDDGLHTYLSVKFPLLDSTGNPYAICGISTDITERKQAEKALAQQAEELARSNAELERFAYVASHDLQEPLRMVVSYLQLLERRYQGKLDATADEFIAYAVDGAGRMQTLIRDLLSYSRVGTQTQSLTLVDSAAILEKAIANLQMAITESGAIVTHDPLPEVMVDPSQFAQLFQNLIGNAIKFHSEQLPQIHISAERVEDAWQFSVRDNGIGIEQEYTERIFIIFQRLHRRADYPGTGIGLAICRKIVERHGGRLWIESEPGQGSIFYFTLPDRAVPRLGC
jgi:PAS domain S-box-containing protein